MEAVPDKSVRPAPRRRRGHWRRLALWSGAALVALALLCDAWVGRAHTSIIHDDPALADTREVALVLGTSPTVDGRPNLYYQARLQTTAALWRAGKVRAIIVSGGTLPPGVDEPTAMKNDLVRMGVPAAYITCDFAGLRTLDSVVRAREVFGEDSYIIVSQDFHLRRALFLARQHGHDAIGCRAPDPGYVGARLRLREIAARGKAVADVVLQVGPRHLGPAVTVSKRP